MSFCDCLILANLACFAFVSFIGTPLIFIANGKYCPSLSEMLAICGVIWLAVFIPSARYSYKQFCAQKDRDPKGER